MADLWDWSSTASSNTTLDGIDVDTNMPIDGIDNAFRTMMAIIRNSLSAGLKNFLTGVSGLGVGSGGTGATTLTGILKGNGTSAVTAITMDGSAIKNLHADGTFAADRESLIIKITDDATVLTSGTGKGYFRMPYAFSVESVKASLANAQTSGSLVTVDINKNGATILSTRITFDNSEATSKTAVTLPVISNGSFADDDVVSFDIDQIGDGTAKGLTVTLIGRQT